MSLIISDQIKKRQSNIELLRGLSMLFILIVHSNYMGITALYNRPYDIESFTRFLIEAIGIVGVNCFILISGYFGIQLRVKKFISLIFQIYFFSILSLVIYLLCNGFENIHSSIYIKSLFPVTNYIWFVPCYFLLMLFSPIVNTWLQNTPPRKILLLAGLIYVVSYYWEVVWKQSFSFGGYSWGFFILLYIAGHLIRRYCTSHSISIKICLLGYLGCVLLLMGISYVQCHYPFFRSLLWSYNCPIIIAESIFLFLIFLNINFRKNIFINWIGRSCFAVLLVHIAPCSTYISWLRAVDQSYQGILSILISSIIIIAYYIIAVLLDQLRLFIWNKGIQPFLSKKFFCI